MSLKSKLRKILPQPSANTTAAFQRLDVALQMSQKRNCLLKLDYHLTEHCNLNCKCCSTYAPLAEKEFTDIEVFKADLTRLRELIGDKLLNLHLLGGEPLLHPDVEQFIVAARAIFPETFIDVVSNGLLVKKMPDSFWNTMKEQDVVLQFSAYPVNLDYVELIEYAKSKGVRAFCFTGEGKIDTFYRKGLDPFGQRIMYTNHMLCPHGDNTQMRQGKLYRCPSAAYVRNLNRKMKEDDPTRPDETFKLHPMDSLDVYKAQSADEVFEFLSNATPFCRYCVCTNIVDVPWEQSKRDIREWVDL